MRAHRALCFIACSVGVSMKSDVLALTPASNGERKNQMWRDWYRLRRYLASRKKSSRTAVDGAGEAIYELEVGSTTQWSGKQTMHVVVRHTGGRGF